MTESAEKLEQTDDWIAAAEVWKQAVTATPSGYLYVRYGRALKRAGRLEEAIAQFQNAITLDGNDAVAYFSLGVAFEEQNRLSEARAALEAGLEIREEQVFLTILGGVLLDMGQLDEAERRLRRSLELRPDDDEALLALGSALKARDPHAAIQFFNEAARLDSNHRHLHRELGYCLLAVKNYDAAETALRVATKADPRDAWGFHYLGHVLTYRNDLRAAKEAFLAAAELRPDVEFFWSTTAEALARLGWRDEADRLLLRALSLDVSDPLTNLQYGLFLKDSGRLQKAVTYLKRALVNPRLARRAQLAIDAIAGSSV